MADMFKVYQAYGSFVFCSYDVDGNEIGCSIPYDEVRGELITDLKIQYDEQVAIYGIEKVKVGKNPPESLNDDNLTSLDDIDYKEIIQALKGE